MNGAKKPRQLTEPATLEDMKAGRAVFSFEGLGKAPVWKLPGERFPVRGVPSVPTVDRASDDAKPEGLVNICQAEDLLVDGKWKRYFGVVSEKGAAVVSAEEIELWRWDAPGKEAEDPFALVSWCLTAPQRRPGFWKHPGDESLHVGDPLPITLYCCSYQPEVMALPFEWVRDKKQSGPALVDAVELRLEWAPFDSAYPVRREFTELAPVSTSHFKGDNAKGSVESDKWTKLFALDLRDWFKTDREGYYRVTLNIDTAALGLRDKLNRRAQCVGRFTVGKPPRRFSVAKYNASIHPFGSDENEGRIRRIVAETARPLLKKGGPLPDELKKQLRWSKPVGGLAARIEVLEGGGTARVLVRLKNTSKRPLAVPTCNPVRIKERPVLQIYVRQGDDAWRKASVGYDLASEERAPDTRTAVERSVPGKANGPRVTLQPGEQCLVAVCGYDEKNDIRPREFKVALQWPGIGVENEWTGTVETPPRAVSSMAAWRAAPAGVLPMPEYLPKFIGGLGGIDREAFDPSYSHRQLDRLLFELLSVYDQGQVRKEFERRMRDAMSLSPKLATAVVAARAGSEEAALLFVDLARWTGYSTRCELHEALTFLFPSDGEAPPGWVEELSLAVLADRRLVTPSHRSRGSISAGTTVGSCETDALIFLLARSGSRKAANVFIERVKAGCSNPTIIEAPDRPGGRRAASPFPGPFGSAYRAKPSLNSFFAAAEALGELKVEEAVPALLKHVQYPPVIDALAKIGDPAAAPVLRKLVADGGKVIRDGEAVCPSAEEARLFAAKKALATWDADRGVARLSEMIRDKSLDSPQRRELLEALAERHDPKAIPAFVHAAKTDHNQYVNRAAIDGLAGIEDKAAVEALIECFDIEFEGYGYFDGKYGARADAYRNRIARGLQRLTGQTFGADKAVWAKWWDEEGKGSGEWK